MKLLHGRGTIPTAVIISRPGGITTIAGTHRAGITGPGTIAPGITVTGTLGIVMIPGTTTIHGILGHGIIRTTGTAGITG